MLYIYSLIVLSLAPDRYVVLAFIRLASGRVTWLASSCAPWGRDRIGTRWICVEFLGLECTAVAGFALVRTNTVGSTVSLGSGMSSGITPCGTFCSGDSGIRGLLSGCCRIPLISNVFNASAAGSHCKFGGVAGRSARELGSKLFF
jgi:hypothetical protein